jgi:hypothetical protein
MGLSHPVATPISGGEIDETDFFVDSPPDAEGSR